MIRLEGAEVLCNSLRTNRVLTNLDLSYNALGSSAAGVLGAALNENNVSSPFCSCSFMSLACFWQGTSFYFADEILYFVQTSGRFSIFPYFYLYCHITEPYYIIFAGVGGAQCGE